MSYCACLCLIECYRSNFCDTYPPVLSDPASHVDPHTTGMGILLLASEYCPNILSSDGRRARCLTITGMGIACGVTK
jgi:hypothetical protein